MAQKNCNDSIDFRCARLFSAVRVDCVARRSVHYTVDFCELCNYVVCNAARARRLCVVVAIVALKIGAPDVVLRLVALFVVATSSALSGDICAGLHCGAAESQIVFDRAGKSHLVGVESRSRCFHLFDGRKSKARLCRRQNRNASPRLDVQSESMFHICSDWILLTLCDI